MMKILGVIPARGGSQRLPGKNIRDLGGKPLIAWTIASARQSSALFEVLVSTDDEGVAAAARKWDGYVPWLRPAELATDTSPSIDAVLHALEWFENRSGQVDGVMLLQPTTPFRRTQTIDAAAALFEQCKRRPIVSFTQSAVIPEWCFRHERERLKPVLGWENVNMRSQDVSPTLQLNGLVYLATPETLRSNRGFVTESTVPFIVDDKDELIDIDTEADWSQAERVVADQL